jgi:hypothetical protein
MKLTQNNGKHNISITTGTITALDIMYLFHQITSKAALQKLKTCQVNVKELLLYKYSYQHPAEME